MERIDDTIILKYLQGECSDNELQQLNDWLRESKENRKELFTLEESFHLAKMEQYAAPDFLDKAEKKLNNKIAEYEKERSRVFFMKRVMQYAAAFIILAVGTYSVVHFTSSSIEDTMTIAYNGSIKEFSLPDGTKVWLNKDAVLKYPKKFATDHRNVSLEGEAYFEVSKDKKRPFTVATDAMKVRVLGTKFNVRSDKHSSLAETSLLEGEVEVTGNRAEGQIILAPGQKAELDLKTGRLCVKQVNAKLDAVWRDDLIPFEKATIAEIASTLERFYNVKIVLSADINNSTYSGVLRKRESIDSVLNSLKNSIPISYKVSGHKIYLHQSH